MPEEVSHVTGSPDYAPRRGGRSQPLAPPSPSRLRRAGNWPSAATVPRRQRQRGSRRGRTAPHPRPQAPQPRPPERRRRGGPLFVAINKAADQQYFIDLQTSFVSKAEELAAPPRRPTPRTRGARREPRQRRHLKGAKGIAITVPDQAIGPAVADAAAAAGVALIATDDNIVDAAGNPVPFVGFNGTDMGNKVGAEAARLLTEGGWLDDEVVGVLAAEKQDLSVCSRAHRRREGRCSAAGVAADRIFAVPGRRHRDTAHTAAGPVITAHPDVTNWVVSGCNDEGVLGAINALATAGVARTTSSAWAWCLRGLQVLGGRPGSGFKSALFISGLDVGAAAAQVLYDNIVNGAALPPRRSPPRRSWTPTTYADVMDQTSSRTARLTGSPTVPGPRRRGQVPAAPRARARRSHEARHDHGRASRRFRTAAARRGGRPGSSRFAGCRKAFPNVQALARRLPRRPSRRGPRADGRERRRQVDPAQDPLRRLPAGRRHHDHRRRAAQRSAARATRDVPASG